MIKNEGTAEFLAWFSFPKMDMGTEHTYAFIILEL